MFTTLISTAQLTEHLSDPAFVIADCRFKLEDVEAGRRAYVEAPPFATPQELLEALRWGTIVGRPSSPLIHLVSRYAALRRRLGWKPV